MADDKAGEENKIGTKNTNNKPSLVTRETQRREWDVRTGGRDQGPEQRAGKELLTQQTKEAGERRDRLVEREKGRSIASTPATSIAGEVRDRMAGTRSRNPALVPRQPHLAGRGRRNPEEDPQGLEPTTGPGQKTTARPKRSQVTWSPSITPDRGKRRNESRLEEANQNDEYIIGESTERQEEGEAGGTLGRSRADDAGDPRDRTNPERQGGDQGPRRRSFLDCRPEMFFLPPLVGPDDEFAPPGWFIEEVARISKTLTRTPSKPPLRFELSDEAADENALALKNVGYDLSRLIGDNKGSTLNYGSEFRTVDELEPLLGQHPNFSALAAVLTHGMPYVFTRELDEVTKSEEMRTLVDRGNHKSAQVNPEQVEILLGKDVHHGFVIPVPAKIIPLIPNAAVQPLGLVQQWTVKEDGTRAIKYRITQDLSFSSNKTGPSRQVDQQPSGHGGLPRNGIRLVLP